MNGIRFFLTIATGLVCFAACGGRGDNTQTDNEKDAWEADSASLRIAVMPTIDCLPLYVAEEEGMFERQGVSVSLYPYQAQMDCDTEWMGGCDGDGSGESRASEEPRREVALPDCHRLTMAVGGWKTCSSEETGTTGEQNDCDDSLLGYCYVG